jgi:translation initiation factor IF-3
MTAREAQQRAYSVGLDLLEISPNADPPVVKILDFGKFKYEQQKKKNEAKKRQKVIEIKEIKVRPNIDENDYQVKMRAMKSFIEEGDKVKVTLRFRAGARTHSHGNGSDVQGGADAADGEPANGHGADAALTPPDAARLNEGSANRRAFFVAGVRHRRVWLLTVEGLGRSGDRGHVGPRANVTMRVTTRVGSTRLLSEESDGSITMPTIRQASPMTAARGMSRSHPVPSITTPSTKQAAISDMAGNIAKNWANRLPAK